MAPSHEKAVAAIDGCMAPNENNDVWESVQGAGSVGATGLSAMALGAIPRAQTFRLRNGMSCRIWLPFFNNDRLTRLI